MVHGLKCAQTYSYFSYTIILFIFFLFYSQTVRDRFKFVLVSIFSQICSLAFALPFGRLNS